MHKKFSFVVLIPARGGSKRIKNKNLKLLCGKPLIDYTIDTAINSGLKKNKIYVSSDSNLIKKHCYKRNVSVIDRPKKFAKDTSSTFSVIKHFIDNISERFDFLILLQPTSPLRTSATLKKSISLIKNKNDCLISVQLNDFHLWEIFENYVNPRFKLRMRTQKLKDKVREDGSIYILPYDDLRRKSNTLGMGIPSNKKIKYIISKKEESIEIDDNEDFKICSKLIS